MKAIERLFQYIDHKGLNKSELERKTGISNGYLAKQLSRSADMGESILNNILENCPDINPEWLLTGNGQMLKNEDSPVIAESKIKYGKQNDNISMPREVFDQITRLTETVLSQQKTIEKLADHQKRAVEDVKDAAPKEALG